MDGGWHGRRTCFDRRCAGVDASCLSCDDSRTDTDGRCRAAGNCVVRRRLVTTVGAVVRSSARLRIAARPTVRLGPNHLSLGRLPSSEEHRRAPPPHRDFGNKYRYLAGTLRPGRDGSGTVQTRVVSGFRLEQTRSSMEISRSCLGNRSGGVRLEANRAKARTKARRSTVAKARARGRRWRTKLRCRRRS